jgi:hypothetical protein
MSATHTPGPWAVGTRDTADNTLAIGDGGKASPLAYVSPRPFYDDTQEANARLIAAAPEMYEILQSIASPGINHGAARALIARIKGNV